MGNRSCGRSKQGHRRKNDLYKESAQKDIERRQLSRVEKYQFFQSIRDQPEDAVISFIEESPWILSSTFWFETDKCSCSMDFELGMKETVTNPEMMDRLGTCINTAMCPHILLKASGVDVSIDKDVSFGDMSKYQGLEQSLNSVRHLNKPTAGLYWIHLAIFFGKDKLIKEILSRFYRLEDIVLVTLCHKFSPILIAILHQRKSIAEDIRRIYPSFIWHESQNCNTQSNKSLAHGTKFDNSLMWTLESHQLDDFIHLWTLSRNCKQSSRRTFKWHNLLSLWQEKILNAIVKDNKHDINLLTKVTGLPIYRYATLFESLSKVGCSTGFKIILEQTDFCHQFIRRKHGKKHRKGVTRNHYLEEIIAREALQGNVDTVKVLIDHGFDVNAKLAESTLLTWTEALNEVDVSELLVRYGGRKETDNEKHSVIHMALDLIRRSLSELDILFVVHRLYVNGFRLFESDKTFLKAYRRHQFCICKYMLLRGEDPTYMLTGDYHSFIWNLMYLIIVSNSCVTFHHILRKGSFIFSLREQFELLSILPEIANESGIQDLVSPDSMEWLSTHLIPRTPNNIRIQWYSRVRSLQSICRSTLSSHFKCFRYLRYLELIKGQIPIFTKR